MKRWKRISVPKLPFSHSPSSFFYFTFYSLFLLLSFRRKTDATTRRLSSFKSLFWFWPSGRENLFRKCKTKRLRNFLYVAQMNVTRYFTNWLAILSKRSLSVYEPTNNVMVMLIKAPITRVFFGDNELGPLTRTLQCVATRSAPSYAFRGIQRRQINGGAFPRRRRWHLEMKRRRTFEWILCKLSRTDG